VVHEENDYGMGSGALVCSLVVYRHTNFSFRQHTGRGTPRHIHSHKVPI
jgi:hypothetical protein